MSELIKLLAFAVWFLLAKVKRENDLTFRKPPLYTEWKYYLFSASGGMDGANHTEKV